MVKYIGGEAIEAIDAEASVYGKGRGSEKFVIMIKFCGHCVTLRRKFSHNSILALVSVGLTGPPETRNCGRRSRATLPCGYKMHRVDD